MGINTINDISSTKESVKSKEKNLIFNNQQEIKKNLDKLEVEKTRQKELQNQEAEILKESLLKGDTKSSGNLDLKKVENYNNLTKEVFDKMSDEDKKEGFKNLIDTVNENNKIIKLKEKRNSLTEDQKIKLYKMNSITVGELIRQTSILKFGSSLINGIKNISKEGGKNAMTYGFLENIPCRYFVELGIFDKPEGLSEEKLFEDIKKDAKNFNLFLSLGEAACSIYAPKYVSVVKAAKYYSKWYESNCVPVMQEKLKQDALKKEE